MTNEEFETYYPKFQRSITAISRKIAGVNETLFEDLVQVGRISLWRFDTTKVTSNLVGCVNRHLRNRMIDFIRAESGQARNLSLDDPFGVALDQLYVDDTGEITTAPYDRSRAVSRDHVCEVDLRDGDDE